MPKVHALPFSNGKPLVEHARTYEGPDQPPEDAIIGECVGEAVRAAWFAGHDPAIGLYVLVSFD